MFAGFPCHRVSVPSPTTIWLILQLHSSFYQRCDFLLSPGWLRSSSVWPQLCVSNWCSLRPAVVRRRCMNCWITKRIVKYTVCPIGSRVVCHPLSTVDVCADMLGAAALVSLWKNRPSLIWRRGTRAAVVTVEPGPGTADGLERLRQYQVTRLSLLAAQAVFNF